MSTVRLLGALTILLGGVSCVDDGISGCGDYDDVPVLAAGSDAVVATSCPAPPALTYQGNDYEVGCEVVPDSLVGGVLVNDGGETHYEGARIIIGIPPDHGFLLEGEECRKGRVVALSAELTDQEWNRIRGWRKTKDHED